MADRRIDQLTESEDISDEDLFVIWKQNISQTRSIAKGTMNLATKSYVDNQVSSMVNVLVPDWSNASATTTIPSGASGYTVPDNGIIIAIVRPSSSSGGHIYCNGVNVVFTSLDGSTLRFIFPVGKNDILTYDGLSTRHVIFVPYKTLNPSV